MMFDGRCTWRDQWRMARIAVDDLVAGRSQWTPLATFEADLSGERC